MAQLCIAAVKDCGAACQEISNYYLMELSKTAQAECNKLNNTSVKIFQELDKTTPLCTDLKDHHRICTHLLRTMRGTTTQFTTTVDFNREAELIDKRFQSRLQQTAELIMEVMKIEIAKHEQRITDMETRLEAKIKESMGHTTKTCSTPNVLPVSKHKHPPKLTSHSLLTLFPTGYIMFGLNRLYQNRLYPIPQQLRITNHTLFHST